VHAPPLRVPIDVNAYSLDHVTTGGNLVSG
jgi:hypothetical protein